MDQDQIIAVGLLTRRDLNILGPAFDRAWPIEQVSDFGDLLRAIDEADRGPRAENADSAAD
jgi:hypothetical protein